MDKQLIFSEIESLMFDLDTLVKSLANSREYISENELSRANTKLSEIEIVADNKAMEKNLLEIKSQIKEIGFEATAIKFSIAPSSSNGGEIGWISGKSMNKEIFKIVNTLKIGDVSPPVRKQESILILKLLDKKSTKIKAENILKLKNQIIDRQKNDLFDLFSKSHLSKIKNLSMIEYK